MSTQKLSTTPYKIAVVEDDEPIRKMFAFKLKREGYEVVEAEDGKEGLEIIKKEKPDLILLDLMMPIMNGDEMLAKLRENSWGSNIRVVILTNLNKAEAPSSLRFLNVDRYIVKAHYTPAQVIDIVREVLAKKQPKIKT